MDFNLEQCEVGDEFEGSAWELSRVISAILAESGTFRYEGRSIIITSLPGRSKKESKTTETKDPVKIDSSSTVKKEEPKQEAPKKIEPRLDLADPGPSPVKAFKTEESKPETKSKAPGRPRKVV